RHTRSKRDWSSDVCSSDLIVGSYKPVAFFNVEKGYGFITPDDASDDVFVHHTAIAQIGFRRLEEGQQVEYIASEGDRGLVADTEIGRASCRQSVESPEGAG